MVLLLCFGFDMAFGALFCKLLQLHFIFNSRILRVRALPRKYLLALVSALMLMDMAIFAVWVSACFGHLCLSC